MAQYIDKDALVAEINRRLEKIANASSEGNRELSAIYGAQQYELINLVQYLNTLEVKEVDLEKEFYDFLDTLIGKDNGHLSEDELFCIAEYFYGLGLKTKGE